MTDASGIASQTLTNVVQLLERRVSCCVSVVTAQLQLLCTARRRRLVEGTSAPPYCLHEGRVCWGGEGKGRRVCECRGRCGGEGRWGCECRGRCGGEEGRGGGCVGAEGGVEGRGGEVGVWVQREEWRGGEGR